MENIIYRIHIESPTEFMDENLYIDINLPHVPSKGDYLRLTNEQLNTLNIKAKASIKVARNYFPFWYLGCFDKTKEDFKKKYLKKLAFDDAQHVKNIMYEADSNVIHIEIGENCRSVDDY